MQHRLGVLGQRNLLGPIAAQRAQRVEDHRHVDAFLEQRTDRGW